MSVRKSGGILIFLLGPNLERDVLPNGLDPVGDELVEDVPRIISPFGYTTCVCVCVYMCGCFVRSLAMLVILLCFVKL